MGINKHTHSVFTSELQKLREYGEFEQTYIISNLKKLVSQQIEEIIQTFEDKSVVGNYLSQVGNSGEKIIPNDQEYLTVDKYTGALIENFSQKYKYLEFSNGEFASKNYIVDCTTGRGITQSNGWEKQNGIHIGNQIDSQGNIGYIKIYISQETFIYVSIGIKNKDKALHAKHKADIIGLYNSYNQHEGEIRKTCQNIESKYIDPLTNIHNVGFAQDLLNTEKGKHNYSFIFFDVADFKNINEVYGHVVGDYILSEMGSIIRNTMRPGDYPVRVGGDEMGLIIDNSDETDPRIIQKNLISIEKRINKELKKIDIHGIDVSIVTSHAVSTQDNPKSLQELKQEADLKLEKGEEGKRNRAEKFVGEELSEIGLVVLLNNLIAKYDRIPAFLFGILLTHINRLKLVEGYQQKNPDYLIHLGHTRQSAEFVINLSNSLIHQYEKQ